MKLPVDFDICIKSKVKIFYQVRLSSGGIFQYQEVLKEVLLLDSKKLEKVDLPSLSSIEDVRLHEHPEAKVPSDLTKLPCGCTGSKSDGWESNPFLKQH